MLVQSANSNKFPALTSKWDSWIRLTAVGARLDTEEFLKNRFDVRLKVRINFLRIPNLSRRIYLMTEISK